MSIDNVNYEEVEIFDINEDNKSQPYHSNKKPITKINCQLEVTLKTDNSVIYVCKSSKQFFTFTALKCFGKGDIRIEGKDEWICNNSGDFILECSGFGTFQLENGGISFMPDECLGKDRNTKSKKLTFKASSCGVSTLFDIIFVFNPCKCTHYCKHCNY